MTKKIITLFSVMAFTVSINAQEFHATLDGKTIENGSTITYNGFSNKSTLWESNPDIILYNDTPEDITVTLKTSYTDSHIQFCPVPQPVNEGDIFGCIPAKEDQTGLLVAEKPFDLTPENTVELKIHWADDLQNQFSPTCPTVKSSVTFSVIYKIKQIYSFTLVFDSNYTAGIDNVAGDGSYVNLVAGNILEYNVANGTKLDIYSLNGATVIERTVNGHGSLSLDRLAPGVYLYKAGELTGKVLVK